MKILITGARGQLGAALQSVLKNHKLFPLSKSELDITDGDHVNRVVGTIAPDVVINCAAYNQVDAAESDEKAAYALNEDGPRHLAKAAAAVGAPIFHFSTDYVFDGRLGRPYKEDDEPNPLSIYGKSKRAGEIAVMRSNPKHVIARTAWLYSVTGKNFAKTILGMSDRPEIRVVADEYGSPTYAPHLARAVGAMVDSGADFGIYHLAGQGVASWYDLTVRLYEGMGYKTRIIPIPGAQYPRPAKRPPYGVLISGWPQAPALPSWERGVADFVKEYRP